MKKSSLILVLLLAAFSAGAQKELRIHQINVGDGDATLIGIYDPVTSKYTSTMLIDGGKLASKVRIVPYLKKILGESSPRVDYVALTHYHDDHYNGLLALADGSLRADSVIDQGGYTLGTVFPAQSGLATSEQKPAKMAVNGDWLAALKKAVFSGYVKGHVSGLLEFGVGKGTDLGKKINLGEVDGQPVVLECVAGWGNTLGGSSIIANPYPAKESPNNFTLAFVLSFGEFRYFIGGDLGGDNSGSYINQELPLTTYFAKRYPVSWSWNHLLKSPGHICGFKANHHGSQFSNTKAFMAGMRPAICMISAGKQGSWQLPRPRVLEDFSKAVPLSHWTATSGQNFSRGLYVTNLFDFKKFASKTKAVEYFGNKPGVSFSYGNATSDSFASYVIRVEADDIAQKSQFQVYRVDGAGASMALLANYFCHIR